jgi:glycosyltransferase involved in cell wall biosynthesis
MTRATSPAAVDFVIPVFNEGANIRRALEELYAKVPMPKRVLIVYDCDEDDTRPVVRELAPRLPGVELVRNTLGRGVLNAIRSGIAATSADVVIVTMADLSDDVAIVPRMVELIRDEGYDIVCASRYMRGGRQIGGPRLKRLLARAAGVSLHWLAGLPTHDATNAFRAYRRSVLEEFPIESRGGFAYSLEITAKAHAAGRRITELPSTWRDRSAGRSRFQLRAWLPHYLRWYFYTLMHRPRRGPRLRSVQDPAIEKGRRAGSVGRDRLEDRTQGTHSPEGTATPSGRAGPLPP